MNLFRLAATSRLSVSRVASPSLIRSTPSTTALRVAGRELQSRAKYATSTKALTSTADGSSQVGKSLTVDADEELRKHAAAWPSWLPKPTVYAAAEQRRRLEEQEQQQQDSKTVAQAEISKSELAVTNASTASPDPPGGPHPEAKKQQQNWSYWRPPPLPNIKHPFSLSRGERAFMFISMLVFCVHYFGSQLEPAPFTGRMRLMDRENRDLVKRLEEDSWESLLADFRGKVLPDEHPYTVRARTVLVRILAAALDLEMDGAKFKYGAKFKFVAASSPNGDEGAPSTRASNGGDTNARQRIQSTKWAVAVVDDPEDWALMTNTGQILVTTGWFNLMDDLPSDATSGLATPSAGADDGLAFTIAHEVAHHLCEHTLEEGSRDSLQSTIALTLAIVYSPVTILFFPHLTNVFLGLPSSRTREREADALGLVLMTRACYDPREAPRAWQRVHAHHAAKKERDLGGEAAAPYDGSYVYAREGTFLSTHPTTLERIKAAYRNLPALLAIRSDTGCPDTETMDKFQRAATRATQGPNEGTTRPLLSLRLPLPSTRRQSSSQATAKSSSAVVEQSQPPSSSPSSPSAQ